MVALILETMLIVLSATHTSNTVEWQSPFYFLLAHDKLQPRTSITIEAMNIAQFKPALGQRVLFGEQERLRPKRATVLLLAQKLPETSWLLCCL